MQKQIIAAQAALAMLLKELIMLPTRIDNRDLLIAFSNIIIDQIEVSYELLYKLIEESEK